MIKMLRVDERLIHGEVGSTCQKVLKITHIVLINNEVVKNEIQKMTLKMAVPQGVKLAIKDVKGGIELLKDERTENMKILVVVNNPSDALTVAKEIKNIDLLNLGNFGLLPSSDERPKKEIAKCIRVNEDELEVLKEIAKLDIPFEAQLTPDASVKDMKKVLGGE